MLPIATTKLHAPSLNAAAIRRRRLLVRLDEGLASGRRLTLVEAPAGYGKSTLLTTWLRDGDHRFAWISLDEGDNDPVRLTACLIAALRRTAGDHLCEATESLIRLPRGVSPETLAAYLISDLESLGEPVVLVLDDYHLIVAEPVHRLVQALLDGRPPLVHLVIASRADPPLSVARWRARGEVTEVRTSELRFTSDESGEFLRQTMRLDLPPEAVTALESRTEGWAAGLQLAGLSLQGRDLASARAFVAQFRGSHRYIIDYLAEEVLREQSAQNRDFLCQTAVLDRLCAPLCDAVTGRSDSRAALAALEQANLFLVPLDDHREFYRYHHLFRDVLRSELTEAEKRPLHRRAALWLEANGYFDEAIRQYQAGGEMAEAVRLIKRLAEELLEAGDLRAVLRWLDAVPDAQFGLDAELAVHRLWALFGTGQFPAAAAYLHEAARLMQGVESPRLRGRFLCVRTWITAAAGDPQAREMAEETLQLVPEDDYTCRSAALLVYGNIMPDAETGAAYCRQAYELAHSHNQPFFAMVALMDLVIYVNLAGRRSEARALAEEGIRLYTDANGRPLPVTGMVMIHLAWVLCEEGQASEARDLAAAGLEFCRQIGFEGHVASDAAFVLARAKWVEGDEEGALADLARVREQAVQARNHLAAGAAANLEREILSSRSDAAPGSPRPAPAVSGAAVGPGEHLTERELELLRLVAAGLSNEEIAGRLFISLSTAKWHVRNVFDKLGAHSRTQAVARARELQLL
jgi:LuxR family transcriptional regulator, maltose regulon positive regulatory protein